MGAKQRFACGLLVLTLLASLLFWPAGAARAAGALSLSAQPATVYGGESFSLQVNIDDTSGLFGAQLSLSYDNTLLEVVRVSPGDIWPTADTFSQASYSQGGTSSETIRFYVSLLDGSSPAAASGSLLTVVFQAREPSTERSALFATGGDLPLLLSDAEGRAIPSTPPDALSVTVLPVAMVSGSASLQAPAADRAISVELSRGSDRFESTFLSGGPFALLAPAGQGYTLSASARCHLSAQQTGVSSPSGGHEVRLAAGDLNGDGTINIVDIAMAAVRFGQSGVSGCANLNGDAGGLVNILDLTIIAGNFGLSAPQPWGSP